MEAIEAINILIQVADRAEVNGPTHRSVQQAIQTIKPMFEPPESESGPKPDPEEPKPPKRTPAKRKPRTRPVKKQ